MRDRGLHRGGAASSGSHVAREEGGREAAGGEARGLRRGREPEGRGRPQGAGARGALWEGLAGLEAVCPRGSTRWPWQARSSVGLWASAHVRSCFWEKHLGQYRGRPPLSPAPCEWRHLFWPVFSSVCLLSASAPLPAGFVQLRRPLQSAGPGA